MSAAGAVSSAFPGSEAGRDAWVLARRREPRAALDPRRAVGAFVEPEPNGSGEVVPVLTVLLTNRECPWRCVFCDLWRHTLTRPVAPGDIPAQVGEVLRDARWASAGPRWAKLYNAGSFFDPGAIPPADDPVIAGMLGGFDRVIVESHPSLVGDRCWRFRDHLARAGRERRQEPTLEVAMGLESADPGVLARLNKRMTPEDFAVAAGRLRREGVAARAFVLVQPPFERAADPAEAAVRSAAFAFGCGVDVVSLIPVRGGNGVLEDLQAEGHFQPPDLGTLERAVDGALALGAGRVLADLWDLERLRGCGVCYPRRRERLNAMNLGQRWLPAVACPACGTAARGGDGC